MRGRRLGRFIEGVANGDPIALIALGVVVLIAVVWLVKTIKEAQQK